VITLYLIVVSYYCVILFMKMEFRKHGKYVKHGYGSPVSQKNTPRDSKSLSINSTSLNTILWYLMTRKADDKSCQLLHQISGASGSYTTDISPIFREEMNELIVVLSKEVKNLDVKDGHINIKFKTNDENVDVERMTGCIKVFFEDLLAFFGKKVSYDNIFII
jgi:hypothetical protein